MLPGRHAYRPALLNDLYHPDSAYVSWRAGRNERTVFELFTRRAPYHGAYVLVAGLEAALNFVRDFRYTDDDLAYLRQIRDYEPAFLEELRGLRFTGDIVAMPEGTVAFPHEPLLRITAPFREAILLESGLLQAVNLATLIATKAARIVQAAAGRPVAEFALRRAQAPYVVSRSARIGGCATTSFLAAAAQYQLPSSGTIPHALVQLFDDERSAFAAVAEAFNRYTLLIDTYDVHQGIQHAIEVALQYRESHGHTLAGVRLDSGDLVADSHFVRAALDEAGLTDCRIVASGDLDEYSIEGLVAAGAPIDAFGVGTKLGVGAGSLEHGAEGGALGGVYKNVATIDEAGTVVPKVKIAGDKTTVPGPKEVYRIGAYLEDVIQLADEPAPPNGERLLQPVIQAGRILPGSLPPLYEIAERAKRNLARLPTAYHHLTAPDRYPVRYSDALLSLRDEMLSKGP